MCCWHCMNAGLGFSLCAPKGSWAIASKSQTNGKILAINSQENYFFVLLFHLL